jgi:transcription elongation factor Elf1
MTCPVCDDTGSIDVTVKFSGDYLYSISCPHCDLYLNQQRAVADAMMMRPGPVLVVDNTAGRSQ